VQATRAPASDSFFAREVAIQQTGQEKIVFLKGYLFGMCKDILENISSNQANSLGYLIKG